MKIKELLENNKVEIEFYAIKDDKGVLFYDKENNQITPGNFNSVMDNFIMNAKAKYLVKFSRQELQLSDLLTDYFSSEEIIDYSDDGSFTYITLS